MATKLICKTLNAKGRHSDYISEAPSWLRNIIQDIPYLRNDNHWLHDYSHMALLLCCLGFISDKKYDVFANSRKIFMALELTDPVNASPKLCYSTNDIARNQCRASSNLVGWIVQALRKNALQAVAPVINNISTFFQSIYDDRMTMMMQRC